MPFRMAIKWIHRFVTVVLLILVAGFVWLNHQPDPRNSDTLQRAYKLSDGVWLYMTVNNQGGAAVPIIYRYYLSHEISGKDGDILRQLAKQYPIIEGTGSVAHASVNKKGEVSISYSGKVFSVGENISNLEFTVKP